MSKRTKDATGTRGIPARAGTISPSTVTRSSPLTPMGVIRRPDHLSTRQKLQLALQFPRRKRGIEDYGNGLTTSESDLFRTVSYSKLLQRSPESFQSFRTSICRPASRRPTRKPKVLKVLGVLKGIRTSLQRKQPRTRVNTPLRRPVPLPICISSGVLSSSDDENPTPWQMTSKYGPLFYSLYV